MATNKSIKIVKPSEPKPLAQNRTQKKDIDEFKPEIPEIKKSAWEILPARYRNLNHRAITAAALRPALAPPRLPGNPSGYFLSLAFSHDP